MAVSLQRHDPSDRGEALERPKEKISPVLAEVFKTVFETVWVP